MSPKAFFIFGLLLLQLGTAACNQPLESEVSSVNLIIDGLKDLHNPSETALIHLFRKMGYTVVQRYMLIAKPAPLPLNAYTSLNATSLNLPNSERKRDISIYDIPWHEGQKYPDREPVETVSLGTDDREFDALIISGKSVAPLSEINVSQTWTNGHVIVVCFIPRITFIANPHTKWLEVHYARTQF